MTWSKGSAVVISTDAQRRFISALAQKLPFDIFITSGTRTPEAQARAMFTKIELGDDLLAIYKDDTFAQSIIDVYPNAQAAADIIQDYAAAGGGSSHLRGMGFDVRTKDKNETQIAQMVAAVKEIGGSPLVEYTPPHLHVTIPASYAPKTGGSSSKAFLLVVPLLLGIWWSRS